MNMYSARRITAKLVSIRIIPPNLTQPSDAFSEQQHESVGGAMTPCDVRQFIALHCGGIHCPDSAKQGVTQASPMAESELPIVFYP